LPSFFTYGRNHFVSYGAFSGIFIIYYQRKDEKSNPVVEFWQISFEKQAKISLQGNEKSHCFSDSRVPNVLWRTAGGSRPDSEEVHKPSPVDARISVGTAPHQLSIKLITIYSPFNLINGLVIKLLDS